MELIVPMEADGAALQDYLRAALADVPRWAIDETLRARDVRRGRERLGAQDAVRGGETLRVFLPKKALGRSAAPRVQVVYEDANILLLDKPQGVSVLEENGGDDMLTRARAHVAAQGGDAQALRLCHRLDAQTGGLLLLSKNAAAYAAAYEAFEKRTMDKRYVCRVAGCPSPGEAELHAYLRKDAQNAQVRVFAHPVPGALPIATAYRVLEAGDISRLQVHLITGRTHQIRAHLAFIGHPIIGDDRYGSRELNRREGARAQQLWATDLTFHASGALAYLEGKTFHTDAPF